MSKSNNPAISVIKVGNALHIAINGKVSKKVCSTAKESDELMRLCLVAIENPTAENVTNIRIALNEKTRIAYLSGLETDLETGEIYLAGYNTPIPKKMVELFADYHEHGYPITAIKNFWENLMLNPDVRVRKSLYDFMIIHDMVMTENGYFIVYKSVTSGKDNIKKEGVRLTTQLENFVNASVVIVTGWKKGLKNYVVYKDLATQEFHMTKTTTAAAWDEKEKNVQFMGNLLDLKTELQAAAVTIKTPKAEKVYTDKHTRKMHIQLGVRTLQKRGKCDSDPGVECSHGLHVGSTKYVNNFVSDGNTVLVCLVNPMNVVAVPDYDKSKIRVCEYFPFATAEYTNGKIEIIEQSYYESDYKTLENDELQAMIAKVKANELPIEKPMGMKDEENRPMPELLKMLENRIIVIAK